jgi:hypothetical protein
MSQTKLTVTQQTPHPIDKLLNYLFTDKRSVYVDDVITNADGSFEVSWCRDYTLYMGNPQWMDTHLDRDVLLHFIGQERLNYWESFRYDYQSGTVQPFSNVNPDLDTFLDENFREVIAEYMTVTLPAADNRLIAPNTDPATKIQTLNSYNV